MTKFILYCFLIILPLSGWSQDGHSGELKRKWSDIQKRHAFRKSRDYKGPQSDGYISPSEIRENQPIGTGSTSSRHQPYRGMSYTPQRQQQGRNPRGPGGRGSVRRDPNITPPEDIDVPEVDSPDIDLPDVDPPSTSTSFWKILGIILLIILIALILYYILKNRQPRNETIPFEPLEENLNPATITKTELELRLEEAMQREDYRECVRIYFLFAMKELIQRRWIFWKREKTNIHYIIEMQGRPTASQFEEMVGIYDLVWYGDYDIDKTAYQRIQPTLDNYYKTLERQP